MLTSKKVIHEKRREAADSTIFNAYGGYFAFRQKTAGSIFAKQFCLMKSTKDLFDFAIKKRNLE